MRNKWLALVVQVPFVAVMWSACNSGDNSMMDVQNSDVTTADVSPDKKMAPDIGVMDMGTGGCNPTQTIDTSQIKWIPPNMPSATACTDVQVAGYYTDCLGSTATSAACNAFTSATGNKNCITCLSSVAYTSSTYGALVAYGGVDYANTGGCIAIELNDYTATGCGAKNEAVAECEYAACATQCPMITDQTTFMEYTTCTAAADMGVCASYINAQCDLSPDGGVDGAAAAAANCFYSNFQEYYQAFGVLFCGGQPAPDGGTTDAATDGPTDAPPG
jgi:hypothetical protein